MSRRILIAVAALVLLVVGGGIALVAMARADAAPNGSPSIRGTITNISPLGSQGVVLVEERPQDQAGSAKASVKIDAATRIYRGRVEASKKGSFSDLRTGQLIEVWFSGGVAESYPVQALAGVVLIP